MTSPDYDIIVLALPRWDGLYSSTAFSLSKELSRFTRVFYIDNPFTIKDFIVRRSSSQIQRRKKALIFGEAAVMVPDASFPELRVATPRLVVPINWLPAGKVYDMFAALNDRIVFQLIHHLMSTFAIRRYVFINSFNPLYGHSFPTDFKPLMKIYHCVDDIRESKYVSKHGPHREAQLLRTSDLTVVTSKELMRLKAPTATAVYYLPNAADVELFQEAAYNGLPRPREIPAGDNRKVIIYMGNIDHRLDYELLTRIADENADTILMMIGPTSTTDFKTSGLTNRKNVVFTGPKKLTDLPPYLAASDCCIIPFLCNTLTKSIYPLKINEYLSAGKPVVTTNFSEDIANFENIVDVCSSHVEFLESIKKSLAFGRDEDAIKRRMNFAADNNWRSRAVELLGLINDKIEKHEQEGGTKGIQTIR